MLPACYPSTTTWQTTLSLINYVNINTDDDGNRNSKGHCRHTFMWSSNRRWNRFKWYSIWWFLHLVEQVFLMLLRNVFHPSSEWVTLVLEGAEVAGLKEHVSYIAWLRDFWIWATDGGRRNRAFTKQLWVPRKALFRADIGVCAGKWMKVPIWTMFIIHNPQPAQLPLLALRTAVTGSLNNHWFHRSPTPFSHLYLWLTFSPLTFLHNWQTPPPKHKPCPASWCWSSATSFISTASSTGTEIRQSPKMTQEHCSICH